MKRYVSILYAYSNNLFQSLSKVVDPESDLQLTSLSPPIMTEGGTKNGLNEKEYTEYFMPVNEHKKSFRFVRILSAIFVRHVFQGREAVCDQD